MDMCDLKRELKKTKFLSESRYKQVNTQIIREIKKAKENWIIQKCIDIGDCLTRNNTKRSYQIFKDLTKPKDNAAVYIQDKHGKCITDKMDVRKRWTQYCSELYSHNAEGDDEVLAVNEPTYQDSFPILESEVEAALRALNIGKSPGVDNIPA